jgi:hypothetical protein
MKSDVRLVNEGIVAHTGKAIILGRMKSRKLLRAGQRRDNILYRFLAYQQLERDYTENRDRGSRVIREMVIRKMVARLVSEWNWLREIELRVSFRFPLPENYLLTKFI